MKNINSEINIERVTPGDGQFFFGYYDLSPESPDGTKILCNKAPFIDRMPRAADELEIGYIDARTFEYTVIGKTSAWNFQEGCRLQWLDDERVIYNIRDGHTFKSEVFDVVQRSSIRIYDIPIYSVAKGFALSYSFTNNKYDYAHTEDEWSQDPYKDGVYLLNLANGTYNRIISNDTLDSFAGIKNSNGHVEYCVFNPKGDKFYLYYRWGDRWGENNNAAYTMVCVSDLNGNVTVLLKSNFISHAGWCGNEKISAWGRLPNRVNAVQNNSFFRNTGLWKIAVSVFHHIVKSSKYRQKLTNDAYIMMDLISGEKCKIENSCFTSDGHCTWSSDEALMLTDTYPDKNDRRHLMIYDMSNDKVYLLGMFYSYPEKMKEKNVSWNFSAMRCDLHPKWGRGKKYIYFDSVHEGYRGLYRIDISNRLEDNSGE